MLSWVPILKAQHPLQYLQWCFRGTTTESQSKEITHGEQKTSEWT